MNRRRHPRVAIDHPAIIRFEHNSYPDCHILNYSEGGLYLQTIESALIAALGIGYHRHTQRSILELAVSGFASPVRVEVVYVNQSGLGVAFLAGQPELVNYLQQVARHAPLQQAEPTNESVTISQSTGALLERLRSDTTAYLETQFDRFLAISNEELITAVNRSSKSRDQADLFFAINLLERQGVQIKRGFLGRVAAGFSDLAANRMTAKREDQGGDPTLQLVDKDDFDEWLLLNSITHRLDSRITRSSQKLELSLSRILHRPITSEANPSSPISLLSDLQEALTSEQLAAEVKPILYAAFSKTVFGEILRLYEQIQAILYKRGLTLEAVDRGQSVAAVPQAETGEAAEQATSLQDAPIRSGASNAASHDTLAETRSVMVPPVSITVENGWSVIKQLEGLLLQGGGNLCASDTVMPAVPEGGEELFASVTQDDLLQGPTRDLLAHLQVPFIKNAVSDHALLKDAKQGGRRFLQVLQELAPYCSPTQNSHRRGGNVTQDIAQLFKRIEQGELDGMDQVIEQLQQLKERQMELFERNRNLAIESFKRNEKLREAHKLVRTSLQNLLLGQSISMVVDKLFQYGWANLLIQTAMLHPVESREWKTYLRVVEVLHRLFRSRQSLRNLSAEHKQELLQIVRKGFSEYPVHPEGSKRFIRKLQRALNDPLAVEDFLDSRLEVDEAYLTGLFVGQMDLASDQAEQPEVENRWLDQVEHLEPGAWLMQYPPQGEYRMVNLAWNTPGSKRYLLIDGNGLKVFEGDIRQLARQFANETIVQPRDMHLPVVDRAMHRMLGKTYEDIEQQISYDELTGLLNRRAFERRLNELLHGQSEGTSHVLIMLDVDQFGLVNDLCGFEGGDQLLQEITHLLHNYLPPNTLLARTGDDEFAILMLQSNLDQGFQIAETQRQSLDAFKYSWANQLIPVSVSVGVVEINDWNRTSGELLKAAAAACSIAKQAGRNCTRVYREDDKAFVEHQLLIKSAASIEDTLARNRIFLVAQAIAPLQNSQEAMHYEILIRVLDGNDNPQAPFHFINAAEKYDLMRSVDRWVVRRFFHMLQEHLDEMAQINGFSLNLSGQSVADADFRAFLKQQIAASPLPREQLGFEITETAMVKDPQDVVRFIEEIRAMGCSFYLDDFGSGYASFAYLKELPVDFIKIDGLFIRDLVNDPASQTMVKSVTEIAHFMGRRVVAEFVEDQSTADVLKGIGVDFIQGYHIGRPVPLHEVLVPPAGVSTPDTHRVQSRS